MQNRPALILLALCLCEVTASFEAMMVYAALPKLIGVFGDPNKAGWLVTGHLIVGAGSALIAARMGDLRGRKKVMLLLLAVAAIGSLISALGTSFWVVLVGRSMQGIIGAMLPLGIGVVREALREDKVPLGVGVIVTASSVGSAAGLIVGGTIVDNFDWHWLFAAGAIMLTVSLVAVWLFVPVTKGADPEHPIDWIDGLMPVSGITSLVLAISLSKAMGWSDPRVLALLAAGLAILASWAWRNLHASYPLINLRLLAERNVAIAIIISVFMSLGTYHVMLLFAPLMQAPTWTVVGLGMSATMAGFIKLPSNLLAFTAGPVAGWIASRYTNRAALIIGSCFGIAGWGLTALMPDSVIELVLLLCLISYGTTMLLTGCLNLVAASVPPASTSEAIASLAVVRTMFMAIGSQVIAVILSAQTITEPGGTAQFPGPGAYQITTTWITMTVVAGLVAALFVRKQRQTPDRHATIGAVTDSTSL